MAQMPIIHKEMLLSQEESPFKMHGYHALDEGFKRKTICYKLILMLIVFGTILYIIDFSTMSLNIPSQIEFYTKKILNKQNMDDDYDDIDNNLNNLDSSYFVNTVGCKMPALPVMNEAISKFIEKPEQITCKTFHLSDVNDKNTLWINRLRSEELEQFFNVTEYNKTLLNCYYQPFERNGDHHVTMNSNQIKLKPGDYVQIKDEFIRVTCEYDDSEYTYLDYYSFIPNKFLNGTTKSRTMSMSDEIPGDGDGKAKLSNKINVMIIGVDSVSRLNMHRLMNKTANTILKKMNGIELIGYNKVGDNTYPNLIPVLTGLDTDELNESCLPYKNSTFDECHFIWDKYKSVGHRTLFAEDTASLGLFNYWRNGFIEQPTDYYWRTFIHECEDNIAYNKKLNIKHCFGSRLSTNIFFDYIRKFRTKTINDSFFSMFWTSTMSHDFFNFPVLMDEHFSQLLLELYYTNFLNDTVLFLMSDHGIRWGGFRNTYQGMMEERLPFLIGIFPQWFEDKYNRAIRNFKRNRRMLTSPFDFYETLKDLVDLDSIKSENIKERTKELQEMKPIPRGISLFLPISKTRTCDDAGIKDHWCSCHEKTQLPTQDVRVQQAAHVVLDSLNEKIKEYPQCKILHLHTIKVANLLTSNEHIVTESSKKNMLFDVTVQIVTKPGFAVFEATIRFTKGEAPILTGTVSRTNLYGKQSSCVDNYQMKLYCYCNS